MMPTLRPICGATLQPGIDIGHFEGVYQLWQR